MAPGQARDHSRQSRALVARGRIDVWVDVDLLRDPARGGGRGRAYSWAWIELMVMLSAVFGLPLRQTQGFTQSLVGLVAAARGLTTPVVPSFATLCRRRRALLFTPPKLRPGQPVTLAVDATGVTLAAPGPWTGEKYGDTRKRKFVKLHAGVDTTTGLFIAAVVTESAGEGTGDVSIGPVLVEQAQAVCAEQGSSINDVLGDGAYDSVAMYEAARDAGASLLSIPPAKARRGRDPDRDRNIVQLDRLGRTRWIKATGYGERAHVEGAFSQLKRVTSERVNARTLEGASAEIIARVMAVNHHIQEGLAA